jgi:tyrosinase
MLSPAVLNLPTNASRSRFDELQQSHAMSTNVVHNVGAFFPFHRYFVHTHEFLLKTVCNYTGAQPYWDEALDAGNFAASLLLDPKTGFGGDGVGDGNCIHDGPFAGYVNPIGPGERVSNHCINRNIGDCISEYGAKVAGKEYVEACGKLETYGEWWPCIEFGPHSAGHVGVGGEVSVTKSQSQGDESLTWCRIWRVAREIRCSICIMRILISCGGSGSPKISARG